MNRKPTEDEVQLMKSIGQRIEEIIEPHLRVDPELVMTALAQVVARAICATTPPSSAELILASNDRVVRGIAHIIYSKMGMPLAAMPVAGNG